MAMNHTHESKVCIDFESSTYSRGFLHGHNPLEHFISLALFRIILFFTVSWTLYFLLRPLKQPRIVCNVLAGILLGPSVLGKFTSFPEKILFPDRELLTVNTVGSFSNITFVFLTAVKMDTATIFTKAREVWSLGLLCTFLPIGISYGLFLLLKGFMPGVAGSIIGFATCAILSTSFLVDISNGMEELKVLTSELGQIALSAATINDAVFWIIVLGTLLSKQIRSAHPMSALLLSLAFAIFPIFVVRPIILWIIRTTPEEKPVNQLYIVSILVGSLWMGLITDALGLGFLPGILAMGIIIPNGPPLGSAIIQKTEPIINHIFMPMFFLRLGHYLDTNLIGDWKECNALLLVIFSGFLLKFLATCLHSLFYNMRVRDVLLVSLMLNFKGVYSLISFNRFYFIHLIDGQSFDFIVLSNVAINSISMSLIELFYKPHLRVETSLSAKLFSTMSLQTTPSIGELRILSCIHKEDDVHGIITLLEACNPTPLSTICAYVVHLLELVGRATPLLAPYTKVGHSSTDRIMRAFTNYSKASGQSAMVQPFIRIAPYKTMYETICRLAQAKHIPLIIVPFHKSQIGEINANFRCFNMQMQAYATSTVGIFVQRGLSCVSCAEFSCNIVVLFIGGADDREALALAARMSSHPCVKITVTRIIIMGKNIHENELEQHLDSQMLKEFKAKTETNASVEYLEVIVTEGLEIFNCIKPLEEKNYDLVMVGKQHGFNLELEEYMAQWTENPELGAIGDMVASDDFCGGTVSVLVLQHCMSVPMIRGASKKMVHL